MIRPGLSICIPTYNRKERLIAQLQSLSVQPDIKSVPIIISDNGSNYSVYNEVLPIFLESLDLNVFRFDVNTSVVVNISSCYLYAKTDWVWILGDDDETIQGVLPRIIRDIKTVSSEVVMIKYSLDNEGFCPNESEIVGNFSEYMNHYKKAMQIYSGRHHLLAGDCAFVSTCVMRTGKLSEIADLAFFYGYNQLAFMVPALFSLGKGGKIQFSSYKIVRYVTPEPGKHWPILSFMLGLCTWRDMPLAADESEKRSFVRMMANMISIKDFRREVLRLYGNRSCYAKYVFGKVMREGYQLPFYKRIIQWSRFARNI